MDEPYRSNHEHCDKTAHQDETEEDEINEDRIEELGNKTINVSTH